MQESTRAREAAVKKDTKEHLDEFRRQQEAAERAAKELEQGTAEVPVEAGEIWAAGPRKRKKGKEGIGGVKIRRTESKDEAKKKEEEAAENAKKDGQQDASAGKSKDVAGNKQGEDNKPASSESPSPPAPPKPAAGLGLGAYSSDDDDDEE